MSACESVGVLSERELGSERLLTCCVRFGIEAACKILPSLKLYSFSQPIRKLIPICASLLVAEKFYKAVNLAQKKGK